MKALRVLVLGLLAAAFAAVAAVAAVGPEDNALPVVASAAGETSPATAAPEGLRSDAASYADDFGVSLAEARKRLRAQDALGDVLARLQQRFPDRFAGGWIEHAPVFRAVARFEGAVPQAARQLAGSDVSLRGGAAGSLAELESRADEVFADVSAALDTPVSTSFDVETGTIEVSIETPADLQGRSAAELESLLPTSARGTDVHVDFTSGSLSADYGIRGGAKAPSDAGGYCTTGFSIAKDGTYGFVTAGHCNNDLRYLDPETGDTYDADHQFTHRGQWGDFQWHSTPDDPELAEFYVSSTGKRDVLGYVGSIAKGDYFCKYGRTAGYDCSTVHRTSVSYRIDGYKYERLVAMKENIGDFGDSGGPFFINNNAVGVLKGYTTIGFKQRSTFSRITYIDDALGLALVVK
jgi:streptogrisin C